MESTELTGKRVLVTGVTGQDGRFLARLLHSRGAKIHGLVRENVIRDPGVIKDIQGCGIQVENGDIADYSSVARVVEKIQPHQVYHLAAMTFVPSSWTTPDLMFRVNTLGTLHLLEAVKNYDATTPIFFACSSEIFGNSPAPQNESTPMNPVSVYGLSKLDGLHLCRQYRKQFGMQIGVSISFNHESEIRPERFVTRKITKQLVEVSRGTRKMVFLGNLLARRDWGYAPDYVEMFPEIIKRSDDFVLGTGGTHSVFDFVEEACEILGLDPQTSVTSHREMIRPQDIGELRADPSKAQGALRFNPQKTSFKSLVRKMVENDLEEAGYGDERVPVSTS